MRVLYRSDSRFECDSLAALPQRSFARTTVGAVTRAGHGLLPTSIDDPDLPPAVAAIQQVHFDIVLPSLDDTRLVALDPLDDEDLEYAARAHLLIAVERLLPLFGPREPKQADGDANGEESGEERGWEEG